MPKTPCVYIRTNRKNGTLYVGVTSHLAQRSHQHETKMNPDSFVAKYKLNRLIYFETHERMTDAIEREKKLKDWPRARKVKLIEKDNPESEDLTPFLVDIH